MAWIVGRKLDVETGIRTSVLILGALLIVAPFARWSVASGTTQANNSSVGHKVLLGGEVEVGALGPGPPGGGEA